MSDFDWDEYEIPADGPGLHDVEKQRLEIGDGHGRFQHCCCYFDDDNGGQPVTLCDYHKTVLDELRAQSAEVEQLTDDASSWHTKYLRESLERERLSAENRSLAEGLRKALIGQGCKPYEADEFVAMHRNSAATQQGSCYDTPYENAEREAAVSTRQNCDHPVHSNPGLLAPCPECGYDPYDGLEDET